MIGKALFFTLTSLFFLGGCASIKEAAPSWESLAFWKKPKIVAEDPKQERWCYRTLAQIDCYNKPQNFSPERLVGVFPESRQPVTRAEHGQALLDSARKKD